MHIVRAYRPLLVFIGFLIFCSFMVVNQIHQNQDRHIELREAFILLHSRGYKAQAEHLYQALLNELQNLPTRLLVDDFQRTLTLVDPARQQPENLVWAYHWTVSNEMEKRSAGALKRALKLAEED